MLTLLLTLWFTIGPVQAQWAARIDGSSHDYVIGVATDTQNNVYVVGYFQSAQLFIYDASGNVVANRTRGGLRDAFIVKYTSDGAFLWAAGQTGLDRQYAYAVAVDSFDNVVIGGDFSSLTLNIYDAKGSSVSTLSSAGQSVSFLVEYSSTGEFLWAVAQTTVSSDNAQKVTFGLNNDLFLGSGPYITKYMPNGSFIWSIYQPDYSDGISVDKFGNVFLVGITWSRPQLIYDIRGAVVKTIINDGQTMSFMVKYTSNGSFAWATYQGGFWYDYGVDSTVDKYGSLYGAGNCESTDECFIYDSSGKQVGYIPLVSGIGAGFLVKYLANGSFDWLLMFNGNDNNALYATTMDLGGNIIVNGYYRSYPFSLRDASGKVIAQLPVSSEGGFTAKYHPNGSFIWVNRQDGTGDDYSRALATDSFDNVYIGGYYLGQAMIIYDVAGNYSGQLANEGGFDGFVVKYNSKGMFNSGDANIFTTTSSSRTTTSSTTTSSFSTFSTQTTAFNALTQFNTVSVSSTSSIVYLNQTSQSSLPSIIQSSNGALFQLIFSQRQESIVSGAKILVPSSTINQQDIQQQQFLGVGTVYIIALAIILVILWWLCILCYLLRRRKLIKRQMAAKLNIHSDVTSMSTTGTQYTTNMTSTAQVTNHVLAVPKFLLLEFGVQFRQGDQIARGGGGSIHFCQVLEPANIPGYDGCKLVVKNLGKNVGLLTEMMRTSFHQEIAMLYLFRDQPQFAKLYGFTEEPATIQLKLYELGSLRQYITLPNKLSLKYVHSKRQFMILAVQLSKGLAYMHSKQFAHNDVKPDNVLLEAKNGFLEPRITDFGISRLLDQSASQVKAFKLSAIKGASIAYGAPEVIHRFRQGFFESNSEVWKAGDVYAFSIVLVEMLNKKKAWSWK